MHKLIIKLFLKILHHRLIVRYHQFLKYCIGGGVSFLVDVGGMIFLTEVLGIWYLLSSVLSFTLAVVVNFIFQIKITFKNSDLTKRKQQFIAFYIIAAIGLALNAGLMYILVEFAGVWYIAAKAIAVALNLILKFIVHEKYTFRTCPPSFNN